MSRPESFEVLDSGARQQFETGAVRDTNPGKGRFDLIPPVPLDRLAKLYEKGALKYEARNWERGIPVSRFIDSALRHINKWREGYRDEDHLIQAVFNLFGAVHTQEMVSRGLLDRSLYDIPTYLGAECSSSSPQSLPMEARYHA